MKKRDFVKYCFVPLCNNNDKQNPDKVFFSVPKDAKTRKKWFKVARRSDADSPSKTIYFCCQDHFNVSFLVSAPNMNLSWHLH